MILFSWIELLRAEDLQWRSNTVATTLSHPKQCWISSKNAWKWVHSWAQHRWEEWKGWTGTRSESCVTVTLKPVFHSVSNSFYFPCSSKIMMVWLCWENLPQVLMSCWTFVIFTKNWLTLGTNFSQKENMTVLECLKIRWNKKICSRLFCGYDLSCFCLLTVDSCKMNLFHLSICTSKSL